MGLGCVFEVGFLTAGQLGLEDGMKLLLQDPLEIPLGNFEGSITRVSAPPPLQQAQEQKSGRIASSCYMVGEFHRHSSCSHCRQFLIKCATKLSNKPNLTFDCRPFYLEIKKKKMAHSQIPHSLCVAKEAHDLDAVVGAGETAQTVTCKPGLKF